MKKTISIVGPIGSFTYKGEEINGVQLADIVAAVTSTKDLTDLVVEYDTPGGREDVGLAIYNYLKSIQPRVQVTSKQIGNIGSIGTVAWFSGSKRIALKGKEFMIHNPWTTHIEGDSTQVQKGLDALTATENKMIDFYSEQTGLPKEAVAPLMKLESTFPAEKAVELKFATDIYEGSNIAAYMKPEKEKSLLDELLALLKGDKKKSTTVAVAPPAELMGKSVMIDGKAPVDGVYTVVGGVITALESVQEEAAEPAAASPAPVQAAFDSKKLDEVLAAIKSQPTPEVILATVNKLVDEKLVAMKKTITTSHVPEGYTPETSADDVKEWDRSYKANEHLAMRKNDPEKYKRIFYAKYGRIPNI